MKYQLIGRKIPHEGKTLWEIVGNLKNFGIGRLVKNSCSEKYSEPCFFKIVKVLPVPPPKNKFHNRGVIVWIEKVFRGLKYPLKKTEMYNEIPKFQLIPKSEEEELLKRAEESIAKFSKKVIPRYSPWPPLYEEIWKHQRMFKNNKRIHIPLPMLKTVIANASMKKTTFDEESITPPSTSSLHAKDVPVENMIKEIVKLKKAIKAHSLHSSSDSPPE